MFNVLTEINWLSVLVAFAAYFTLGGLWPMVFFNKHYRMSLGRENEPQPKPRPIDIIGPAVCTFVITSTSAILIHLLKIDSYENVLLFALLVGFGYLFSNTTMIAINPNIPRPLLYGFISGMYHFIGISIVSILLVAMR